MLEPPSKFVSNEVTVQLACRLLFVDMEGLNDGRAVKAIVPKVEPRKLVRGTENSFSTPLMNIRFSFTGQLRIQTPSCRAALVLRA